MNRREFIYATAATLAAQGGLPLLAASKRKLPNGGMIYRSDGGDNRFVKPAAISPVTGYLPEFSPVTKGSMAKDFSAKYKLIRQTGQINGKGKANNSFSGSLDLSFSGDTCKSTEVRIKRDGLNNTVKTELHSRDEFNTVSRWTLDSSVAGVPESHLAEEGTFKHRVMTLKTKSWSQDRYISNLLIGRWALIPLISSGKIKSKPLVFDMLDESTLRPDQTLRYTGQIEIPVAGGTATLDSYAQTGWGIVPTHYLVDGAGRVQLITMSGVNWALSDLRL